jgi:hypothetical protein
MSELTIEQLMRWNPCYDRDRILEIANGKTEMTAIEIANLDIPVEDRLWVLLRPHFFSESDLRMIVAAFAEQSLKYFERYYPDDARPRDAIKASRLFSLCEISAAARDAARDAAWAAARDAASDAARDAAWDAASDAAWAAARAAARDAAWAAARAAAWDAAWDAQLEIVRIYIEA